MPACILGILLTWRCSQNVIATVYAEEKSRGIIVAAHVECVFIAFICFLPVQDIHGVRSESIMASEINDCPAGRIMGDTKSDDAHSKHPTPNANLVSR